MRPLILALTCTFLLLPSLAFGQQDKVWIDCFHGDAIPYEGPLDDFVDAMYTAGASEVMVTTELPSSLTDGTWRLLVMCHPHIQVDDNPDINIYLSGFLASGGRLVLLGDNSSEALFGTYLREILDALANDLSLNEDDEWGGCSTGHPDATPVADPLTEGQGPWHLARANSVSGGDPLLTYQGADGSTTTLAAVERTPGTGEIVLFGDIEGFVLNCRDDNPGNAAFEWADDHRPLWMNLFGAGGGAVDSDNDGYNSEEDCNDSDPFIYPGAEEVCNNTVDDDCDGLVDADDPACQGGDDADDDAWGDDDDTTPFEGGEGGWGGGDAGCCGASNLAGARVGAGLCGLLLLGAVAVRRSGRPRRPRAGPRRG